MKSLRVLLHSWPRSNAHPHQEHVHYFTASAGLRPLAFQHAYESARPCLASALMPPLDEARPFDADLARDQRPSSPAATGGTKGRT